MSRTLLAECLDCGGPLKPLGEEVSEIWVGDAAGLLRPLVAAIRRHVLAGPKLHADDTPVPVLAPGQGHTKTDRLWTYVRDDRPAGDLTPPAVWFAYSPNRRCETWRE